MINSNVSEKLALQNTAIRVAKIDNHEIDHQFFYGHKIAKPHENYFIFDKKLLIAGWVVGKTAVKSVEAYLGDTFVDRAFLDVSRPGLMKRYGELAQKYQTEFGFHQTINLPELESSRKLTLKACFKNGSKQEIGRIILDPVDLEHISKPAHISPDFMVIGAMKAATSAIYNYISRHSRVLERNPKEIHFFSKAYVYQEGWNWYLSQFAIKQKIVSDRDIIVGEASPSYISDPNAAGKIKQAFPNIKIVASLRNPTDRAISHYHHQVKRVKDETREITEAFSPEEIAKSIEAIKLFGGDEFALRRRGNWRTSRYLYNGLYALQLRTWLEVFPPEQLLILDFHQLEKEPDIFLDKLFTFLDLQDEMLNDVQKVYANSYPDAPPEVVERLNNYFQPYNQELKETLGIDFNNY